MLKEILENLLIMWACVGGMFLIIFLFDYLTAISGEDSWFFNQNDNKKRKK